MAQAVAAGICFIPGVSTALVDSAELDCVVFGNVRGSDLSFLQSSSHNCP